MGLYSPLNLGWVLGAPADSFAIMITHSDVTISLKELSNNLGISFGHWNSRSLFPKFENVDNLLKTSNLEFLLISETWLNINTSTELVDISGYNFFRLDRDPEFCKQRGGGVGLYCKDKFNVIQMNNMCISCKHLEVLTCKLKLINTRDIYIMTVYRPPDSSVLGIHYIFYNNCYVYVWSLYKYPHLLEFLHWA